MQFLNQWNRRHIGKKLFYFKNGVYFNRSQFTFHRLKINLLIIGAQKSGTTSLYSNLQNHPEIFMSLGIKEPGFFIWDEWAKQYFHKKGYTIKNREILFRDYMAKGYAGQKYFGEASTHYTLSHRTKEYSIPEKVYSYNPNMKIIYLVRNPFERIVSGYKNYGINIGEINTQVRSDNSYLWTSQYYQQIKYWKKVFPEQNIKIILFEEMIQNPEETLNRIYKFLKVLPKNISLPHSHKTKNNSKIKFDDDTYDYLFKNLIDDITSLKTEFNLPIDRYWNISKENWVNY